VISHESDTDGGALYTMTGNPQQIVAVIPALRSNGYELSSAMRALKRALSMMFEKCLIGLSLCDSETYHAALAISDLPVTAFAIRRASASPVDVRLISVCAPTISLLTNPRE
jgi:hypothetical protein